MRGAVGKGSRTSGAAAVVDVRVGGEVISAAALACRVGSNRAGAVATFEGVIRDHHEGKAVSFLEYEAYVPMSEAVLRDIAERACDRWEIEAIAVHHRIGRLEIGEVSVAIAVSAAHRGAAFDALRYVIDTLKNEAPIWKRETGPDGTFWVEGPDLIAAPD